jgi:uncharacterized protein (TIGR02444 family)
MCERMTPASPFWTFSLQIYGRPGVPAACVRLQDQCGVDVNILLFCLFLARNGRALMQEDVQVMDSQMRDWRLNGVIKLREARRVLKEPPEAFKGLDVHAFRERVKAIELEAERLQQECLFALRPLNDWGKARPYSAQLALDNMSAYAKCLGVNFPAPDVEPLVGTLDNNDQQT